MPEGPELHLAAKFITAIGQRTLFGGQVVKSAVSTKNPDVEWNKEVYRVRANSRGKELKVVVTEGESEVKGGASLSILFRFGMSGSFKYTPVSELPKHAHLQFYTINEPIPMVLSFVDYRRFGRWEVEGEWGADRGPDPIWEYQAFRSNVMENLKLSAFNRPICEAMLNQKFFNGIGNYLRAEILYRCGVRPFDEAREVLSELKPFSKWYETQVKQEDVKNIVKQEDVQKIVVKQEDNKEIVKQEDVKENIVKQEDVKENIVKQEDVKENIVKQEGNKKSVKESKVKPDLLDLCHILPKEVVGLEGGGKGYNVDPDANEEEYAAFRMQVQEIR
ncbi:Endonuclease 8-like 1 [Portunus trituberculatus]|uniref:Endonuclease 8-like 1 n=1 Tax=Portunus trituberculatus TaxID=210409 RepID=A0A5B7EEK1_PORTR|nr:Endonuclease 8-like 1 [Portunus trituberculatus]